MLYTCVGKQDSFRFYVYWPGFKAPGNRRLLTVFKHAIDLTSYLGFIICFAVCL